MDNIQELEEKFKNAQKALISGRSASTEKAYAQAYANLVKAGLRPQLKKKYRIN